MDHKVYKWSLEITFHDNLDEWKSKHFSVAPPMVVPERHWLSIEQVVQWLPTCAHKQVPGRGACNVAYVIWSCNQLSLWAWYLRHVNPTFPWNINLNLGNLKYLHMNRYYLIKLKMAPLYILYCHTWHKAEAYAEILLGESNSNITSFRWKRLLVIKRNTRPSL